MTKSGLNNFFFIIFIFLLDRVTKIIVINSEKNEGVSNYSLSSFLNIELIFHTKVILPTFSFLLLKLVYKMPAFG